MSIKAKLEALIYAAEDPVSLDQMAALLKEDLLALRVRIVPEPNPEPNEDRPGAAEARAEDIGPPEVPGELRNEARDEAPPEVHGQSQREFQSGPPAAPMPALREAGAKSEKIELRVLLQPVLDELIAEFNRDDHGIEIREVARGYRMSTKPEHHDVVRAFAKSLKPLIRLSLQALETLAVIAYKQPVTVPEISEIRGADSAGVIGTLLERKLITTAGRKAVVGRPMLYKTTKDFLVRFGLKDIGELPSIEEFEKIAADRDQGELFMARDAAIADATGIPDEEDADAGQLAAAEARVAEDRSSEDRVPEDWIARDHVFQGRSSEDRSSEGRSSEDRSSEDRSSEGRSSEGRSSEGRSSEEQAPRDEIESPQEPPPGLNPALETHGPEMAGAPTEVSPDAQAVAEEEPSRDEVPENDAGIEQMAEDKAAVPQNVTEPSVSSDPQHTQADEEAAGQVASESTGG